MRRVILTGDVPERGLRAGDVGSVVERHIVSGVAEEGDCVEFFDMIGNTVTVVRRGLEWRRIPPVPASALRPRQPIVQPPER